MKHDKEQADLRVATRAGTLPTPRPRHRPYATGRRAGGRRLVLGMLALLTATLMWPHGARPEPVTVVVVLSEQTAPYQEVVSGLRERLQGTVAASSRLVVAPWQELAQQTSGLRPVVWVAVGVKAMQTVFHAHPSAPVVCGLVPRRAVELAMSRGTLRESPGGWTALYLDQPAARQLDLMRIILQGRQRVGVLLGSESEGQLDDLRALARERRITLHTQVVNHGDELAPALQRAAEVSDAIWMLPDTSISNAGSVRDLLLASYRYKRPVIGFSQGYVRAGALAAVYSTPAQVGGELGAMLLQTLSSPGRLPAPRHPVDYEVALNYHVARSYGLHLEDEQTVLKKLRTLERQP